MISKRDDLSRFFIGKASVPLSLCANSNELLHFDEKSEFGMMLTGKTLYSLFSIIASPYL